MKRIHNIILKVAIGLFSVWTVSCFNSMEKDYPLVKLGAGEKEYVIEVDGGVVNIPVYSNGSYHLEMISSDNEWLKLKMPSNLSENGYIRAECDFNASFRRQVVFSLCSDVDERRDTVTLRQKGLKEALLSTENRSLITKGAGGEDAFEIKTNIPSDQIEKAITYSTESGTGSDWIKDIAITEEGSEKKVIKLTTDPNPEEEIPRTAIIRLKFIDGWGETVSLQLNVIQRTSLEKVGTEITIDELKYEYVESGRRLESYVIVEGIVVSSKKNRNAGENEQLTTSTIDYTVDQRTIYLESLDGSKGICLVTSTVDDNQVDMYDHVQVLLYGTDPHLYEDPSYLVINGVKSSMFISVVPGESYDVPVKERHIGDITDEDIFTYVKLKDVEIPVRKGDLMPVNEGYTIAANGHRLVKFPRLIRDINGDDMYLYTNSTCQFRNDGTLLPYGSGSLSGVVVHERFPRFEWENLADPTDMEYDPLLGRIGTYQIRPQTKDDIWKEMGADVENSFSKLLTEYRFWNPDESRGVCLPTYGHNGWFTHTYQAKYTGSSSKDFTENDFGQHFVSAIAFDYLGPKGKNDKYLFGKHVGNENGLGIILNPLKESWNSRMDALVDQTDPAHPQWCGPGASDPTCQMTPDEFTSINYYNSSANIGKGLVPEGCYTTFAANNWWDYETGRPYGWLLCFSTSGISATSLSLQVAQLNTCQSFYTPRYWKLEWSTTDNQTDLSWQEIAQYTVPDISVWSTALYHSVVGFKQMNFALPLEMLGKDKVYIRLTPRNDICSSGADYADARLNAADADVHTSSISYIAVRYN